MSQSSSLGKEQQKDRDKKAKGRMTKKKTEERKARYSLESGTAVKVETFEARRQSSPASSNPRNKVKPPLPPPPSALSPELTRLINQHRTANKNIHVIYSKSKSPTHCSRSPSPCPAKLKKEPPRRPSPLLSRAATSTPSPVPPPASPAPPPPLSRSPSPSPQVSATPTRPRRIPVRPAPPPPADKVAQRNKRFATQLQRPKKKLSLPDGPRPLSQHGAKIRISQSMLPLTKPEEQKQEEPSDQKEEPEREHEEVAEEKPKEKQDKPRFNIESIYAVIQKKKTKKKKKKEKKSRLPFQFDFGSDKRKQNSSPMKKWASSDNILDVVEPQSEDKELQQVTLGGSMDGGGVPLYDNLDMNDFGHAYEEKDNGYRLLTKNEHDDKDNGYRLLTKSSSFDCEQSLVSKRVEALRQSPTAEALYAVIQKKNFGRLDEVRDPILSPSPCLDGFARVPRFDAIRNAKYTGGTSEESSEYESLRFFHISPLVHDQLQESDKYTEMCNPRAQNGGSANKTSKKDEQEDIYVVMSPSKDYKLPPKPKLN